MDQLFPLFILFISSLPPHNSPSYSSFVSAITVVPEPHSFKQASLYPEWQAAMKDELDALISNNTWSLVSLPPGKNPISCRWVYRVKFAADGSIERYKERLVARGFTQQAGIDYLDTFSPVAKLVSVKLMLALSAAKGWSLHHLDINNAFYMEISLSIFTWSCHRSWQLRGSMHLQLD